MLETGIADISKQNLRDLRETERRLKATQERYRSLFDNNFEAVFALDFDGHLTDVNQACEQIAGYSVNELQGMNFLELLVPEECERALAEFEQLKMGHQCHQEFRIRHKSGRQVQLSVTGVPVFVNDQVAGLFAIAKDITAQRHVQMELAMQSSILERMIGQQPLERTLARIADAVEQLCPGWVCSIELADASVDLRAGVVEQPDSITSPILSAAGSVLGNFSIHHTGASNRTGRELDIVHRFSHLASLALEQHHSVSHIQYLAYHDTLTGLPNRQLFHEQLSEVLEDATADRPVAVLLLDLDRFKSINDSLGHTFGDKLLKEVAIRIQDSLNGAATLARIGGDEFIILHPDIRSERSAGRLADRIIQSFRRPLLLDGVDAHLMVSIGIAMCAERHLDPQTVMRNADVAMYTAKNDGKGTYRIYDDAMSAVFYERMMLETSLERALEHNEFSLHYQPRVDVGQRVITSAEALIRWRQSTTGLVSPGVFIPIAEETGQIVEIGMWVLEEVCRQIKRWEDARITPVRIAVNVSPVQLRAPQFIDQVRSVLERTDVDPKWLEIEVTESAFMDHREEVLQKINWLKVLGIQVSIDDFGIGYSSLARLTHLPVNALKIDRSFIENMRHDEGAVARTIIALGHNLKLTVVAEGVETEDQHRMLADYGCDEMQGFLYSRPMPLQDFEQLLRRPRPVAL